MTKLKLIYAEGEDRIIEIKGNTHIPEIVIIGTNIWQFDNYVIEDGEGFYRYEIMPTIDVLIIDTKEQYIHTGIH